MRSYTTDRDKQGDTSYIVSRVADGQLGFYGACPPRASLCPARFLFTPKSSDVREKKVYREIQRFLRVFTRSRSAITSGLQRGTCWPRRQNTLTFAKRAQFANIASSGEESGAALPLSTANDPPR